MAFLCDDVRVFVALDKINQTQYFKGLFLWMLVSQVIYTAVCAIRPRPGIWNLIVLPGPTGWLWTLTATAELQVDLKGWWILFKTHYRPWKGFYLSLDWRQKWSCSSETSLVLHGCWVVVRCVAIGWRVVVFQQPNKSSGALSWSPPLSRSLPAAIRAELWGVGLGW